MAREDLNPIEEARACAALVEELGLTREEVGRRVGRSRVAVSNLLRLLDLPDEAIELLARRRAERGPRPRAAARRGPRRAPAPRSSRRPSAAGRYASSRTAHARAPVAASPGAGARAVSIPTRRRARPPRPTRSGPRSAPRSRSRAAEAASGPRSALTRWRTPTCSPAVSIALRFIQLPGNRSIGRDHRPSELT